jgi:hypothetical protein
MAPTELFTINASVGTTEISIPTGTTYSSGSPQTSDYTIMGLLSFENMAAGDQYQIRVYEKVISGGTQLPIYEAVLTGAQPKGFPIPALMVMHGWDVTVKKLTGTDRTIIGSIRGV